jgi:hypothetical protein
MRRGKLYVTLHHNAPLLGFHWAFLSTHIESDAASYAYDIVKPNTPQNSNREWVFRRLPAINSEDNSLVAKLLIAELTNLQGPDWLARNLANVDRFRMNRHDPTFGYTCRVWVVNAMEQLKTLGLSEIPRPEEAFQETAVRLAEKSRTKGLKAGHPLSTKHSVSLSSFRR